MYNEPASRAGEMTQLSCWWHGGSGCTHGTELAARIFALANRERTRTYSRCTGDVPQLSCDGVKARAPYVSPFSFPPERGEGACPADPPPVMACAGPLIGACYRPTKDGPVFQIRSSIWCTSDEVVISSISMDFSSVQLIRIFVRLTGRISRPSTRFDSSTI